MNENEPSSLNEAELQDIVVAATAQNEAEAMYLTDRLEDAGIPIAAFSAACNLTSQNPEIRVPRLLQARAHEVIEAARQEAKARSLENAFDTSEIDAKDVRRDPLLQVMANISTLHHDQKEPMLTEYIVEWLAAGVSNADIARYLSLAELSPDEARALVAHVYENQIERVREKRDSNVFVGSIFILGGVLLFAWGYVADGSSSIQSSQGPIGALFRVMSIGLILLGISKAATTPKLPSRLEEPAKPEEDSQTRG